MPTRPRPSAIEGSDELRKGEIVIYQDKHKKASLEVRLVQETVWLSQAQMADLFGKDIRTVSEHIQNIYKEGELKRNPTVRKFRIVQIEGKRKVEEKAAHLLYFVIKDHPFADGNKRIGSFLFIMFLSRNHYLFKKSGERKINDNALVALALLIAESKPSQKDVMVKLIINLLTHSI